MGKLDIIVSVVFFGGLLAQCHAHGVLIEPISRSLYMMTGENNGYQFAGECPNGEACQWYSQKTTIPGETTNCDAQMRTMGVSCGDSNPTDFPCTEGAAVPWCAPGTAAVKSPCGIFSGGYDSNGRDMLDLPVGVTSSWVSGGEAQVAWAITANHGGGYAYRICPATESPTEECFQSGHLEFSSDKVLIMDPEGEVVSTFDAVRTSNGTWPQGSTWARNPFPMSQGVIDSIPGLPNTYGRGPFNYSVVDKVAVPSDLSPGRYIVSWRWDAEQTKQVWSQCGDVMISSPTTTSTERAETGGISELPSGAQNLCTGGSLGLDVNDCDAWVELYDSLGGAQWPDSWRNCDGDLRTDPCGCDEFWQRSVVCTDKRDLLRISEIYLMGDVVKGNIPESISSFSELAVLSLVATNITGSIPDSIGSMSSLEMVWLDHNPLLGGELPQSLSQLSSQLTVFEAHGCSFSGELPSGVNWSGIADCTLNGLTFNCPLPDGAETCGAACA